MSILLKEHFNRWYSLKAYYTSITLIDLPISVGNIILRKILNILNDFIYALDHWLSALYCHCLFVELSTNGVDALLDVFCHKFANCICRSKLWPDDWCLV